MAKSVEKQFAIGVDYGTNSVRALVVDVQDGSEIATCVFNYPSGDAGILLDRGDPNLARQNPADYIEGFYKSVKGAVQAAAKQRGFKAENVIGIGIDTTGSTPIPVDRDGMPLALEPALKKNLSAHAWLWKDHTSYAEAAEITQRAAGCVGRLPDQVWRLVQQRMVLVQDSALQACGTQRVCGGVFMGRVSRFHPRVHYGKPGS